MPIFRVKSVKIYTGQKNLHWRRRPRRRQLSGMHVMSLAIQDLTPCSRDEGLSDIMARNMDSKRVEKENNVTTEVFGVIVIRKTKMYQTTLEGRRLRSTKSIKSSRKKVAKAKNSKLNFYTTWPGQVKTTQFIRRHQVSCCHNKAITARLPPWRVQHWRSLKRPDPKTQSRSAKILIFFSWTPVLFALPHFTNIQTVHFRNIFETLYFVLQVSPAGRGGLGSNKRVAKPKYQ